VFVILNINVKMERNELEERLKDRIVLNELRLLDQHLQTRGNGANIHNKLVIRQRLEAINWDREDKGTSKITFIQYKKVSPTHYKALIKTIDECTKKYEYKV